MTPQTSDAEAGCTCVKVSTFAVEEAEPPALGAAWQLLPGARPTVILYQPL